MDIFIASVGTLVRHREERPPIGYNGLALEFVEDWDKSFIAKEVVCALILFVIFGTVVGVTTESMEKGFIVGGLGVSLSQLLFAGLVLFLPPPQPVQNM